MYNYLEELKKDIKEYIKENESVLDYDSLYDELFLADSVTGNVSGSYYFNTWKAEEAICHNLGLLREALKEFAFEDSVDIFVKGAEWCDVIIRCYLLDSALTDVLEELKG